MASIVAKKRGKNVYYYYVESVRKNGFYGHMSLAEGVNA